MDIVERLRNRMTVDFDAEGEIQDVPDKECIEAADEIEKLREALKFYADEKNYEPKDGWFGYTILADKGEKARAALKEGE